MWCSSQKRELDVMDTFVEEGRLLLAIVGVEVIEDEGGNDEEPEGQGRNDEEEKEERGSPLLAVEAGLSHEVGVIVDVGAVDSQEFCADDGGLESVEGEEAAEEDEVAQLAEVVVFVAVLHLVSVGVLRGEIQRRPFREVNGEESPLQIVLFFFLVVVERRQLDDRVRVMLLPNSPLLQLPQDQDRLEEEEHEERQQQCYEREGVDQDQFFLD